MWLYRYIWCPYQWTQCSFACQAWSLQTEACSKDQRRSAAPILSNSYCGYGQISQGTTYRCDMKLYPFTTNLKFHNFVDNVYLHCNPSTCCLYTVCATAATTALRSTGQAVISSREIGSMNRKSRGRGRSRPIWEVQCKQSPLFNHPSSRSELDSLWCSPRAPPPPCHPLLPNGRAEGQPGEMCRQRPWAVEGLRERQGGIQFVFTLWDPEKGDERMWSGAGVNWSSVNCRVCL